MATLRPLLGLADNVPETYTSRSENETISAASSVSHEDVLNRKTKLDYKK